MALTRKFLTALGIESEKQDEIIAAHAETVDGLKAERDQYKENAEKLTEVQKELDALKADSSDGKTSYKDLYTKEHEEFEKYKSDQSAKETRAKKTEAYRKLLKDAGVSEKHLATVLKASDVDSIELDEKGAVKDSKKVTDSIKTEWGDLITTTGSQGAGTATPPAGDGRSKYHGTGRAAQIAKAYHESLYGSVNSNGNGGEGNAAGNGNNGNGGEQ